MLQENGSYQSSLSSSYYSKMSCGHRCCDFFGTATVISHDFFSSIYQPQTLAANHAPLSLLKVGRKKIPWTTNVPKKLHKKIGSFYDL